jgi:hypothetical protein
LLEFVRQRSFSKESARNSSVALHRLAEGRAESVNFGPTIQPFPDAAARDGGYSGREEAAARPALEFRNRFTLNLRRFPVHGECSSCFVASFGKIS